MKRHSSIHWVVLILLIGISACTVEGSEQLLQGKEIKLASEIIPSSRVSGQGMQHTQIDEGRQLGVTITGAQNQHVNKAWTALGDGTLVHMGDKVTWGNTDANIVAYHPYNAGWMTEGEHSFSVNLDQSTEVGYLASDLLWATAVASPSDDPVSLTFTHKLAKISVTLTSDDIPDLSGAEVYIYATIVSKYFNPMTGELGIFSGNTEQIKAGSITKDNSTVSAIVIPQFLYSGTRVIKILFAGREYCYDLTRNTEYKSGYSYHYNLKIYAGNPSAVEDVNSDGVEDMEVKEW